MKKIRTRNKVLGCALLVILAAVTGLYIFPKWYIRHGEKMIPYSINPPDSGTRILIAVQKSPFKDAALDAVAAACLGQNIHISVVDVDDLPAAGINAWDKIIIFSAIMMWDFYPAVKDFLDAAGNTDKIFMYNTSGSTRMRYKDIDTLNSASVDIDACVSDLLAVIDRAKRI
ncbi:MAG: hypothetical protein LBQ57_02415 [Spirochaetales bacterium]|jgi:hypothetical protein|nr:hypothetical protein [Spirochaetales bacterium]